MFNFALKREQRRALYHLFEEKEFGKSLFFQLLLLLLVDIGSEKQKAWRCRLRERFSAPKYHLRPGFGRLFCEGCQPQHCVLGGRSRNGQGISQLVEVTTITVQRKD